MSDPGARPPVSWDDLALRCPACATRLEGAPGEFRCPACARSYPVVDGVPRFVTDQGYAASFGFEWERHRVTQLDSVSGLTRSRDDFTAKTGLRSEELAGKLVLDVGVGSGRYSEVAADMGATVVGLDLSAAAAVAAGNLGDRGRFVQADLFHAPFADETFDVVFSIGVLHHTPDTRAATEAIARLVKPGGILAIWVYAPAFGNHFSNLYRRATTRMTPGALYRLSAAAAHLHALRRVPIAGRALRTIVPISGEARREWRVLDTFDWYAPRYQWHHTRPEVASWFEGLGFEEIRALAPMVAVRGRRPA